MRPNCSSLVGFALDLLRSRKRFLPSISTPEMSHLFRPAVIRVQSAPSWFLQKLLSSSLLFLPLLLSPLHFYLFPPLPQAGAPLALRALIDATNDPSLLPKNLVCSGTALVAPAVLDFKEDSDLYEDPKAETSRIPNDLRIRAFKALLAMPDAFTLKFARRLVDERDPREALLNQTHKRMAGDEMKGRVDRLVEKYTR